MKSIELLAPAGSPEALDAAIAEGADAVYLGLRSFNARMRSANFAYAQFEGAVRSLHRLGKKLYVTANTVVEQREMDRMYQFLQYLAKIGPDGIIVQDLGVARMARSCFPSLKVHASTQMNVASARGVNLLSREGISRVVLSRELSLQEIRDIRDTSSAELEVFVHGALCVSESGLCLFSSYLGGKSANRGMCAQACRRKFQVGRKDEISGFSSLEGTDFAVDGRTSDSDGVRSGYFFSPADFQLIADVPDLAGAGVASLKIEGRMKSAEYVGTVVAAYRLLLDTYETDPQRARDEAERILRNDFARAKTRYFFGGSDPALWLDPHQAGGTGIALGKVEKTRQGAQGNSEAFVRCGDIELFLGDSVRFHRSDDSDRKSVKLSSLELAGGGAWIPLPEGFGVGDPVYVIQTKSMSKRYPRVLPPDLAPFRTQPGRDSAPALQQERPSKEDSFPDGLYVQVSRVEDLFILQSLRPVRVLLSYTRSVAERFRAMEHQLPFKGKELVFVLDPFFPQTDEGWLQEETSRLLADGYTQFVVNNLGHLSLFRGTTAKIAAGPYLYSFNRWAVDLLSSWGLSTLFSPLENSRQNLEKTIDPQRRGASVIPIFAYPALFRIRADLSRLYDFNFFSDGRGDTFELLPGSDGSIVVPDEPFSITDKTPFLKNAGFSKFLLDFSGPTLTKRQYKIVMEAARDGLALPGTRRFNWKDGFFSPETGPEQKPRDSGTNRDGVSPKTGSHKKTASDNAEPRRGRGKPGSAQHGTVGQSRRGGGRTR